MRPIIDKCTGRDKGRQAEQESTSWRSQAGSAYKLTNNPRLLNQLLQSLDIMDGDPLGLDFNPPARAELIEHLRDRHP